MEIVLPAIDPKKPAPAPRIDCVGIICFRGEDVLLIQRGTAPRKGEWSIPGGRIEANETQYEAACRELYEETAITAKLGKKVAIVDAEFEGFYYRLHDFVAEWVSGHPTAGDDAVKAEFVAPKDLPTLGIWPQTLDVIETARMCLDGKQAE